MSTINGPVNHGITLGTSGAYATPLVVTKSGSVSNNGTGDAIYGPGGYAGTWGIYNQGLVSAMGAGFAAIDLKSPGSIVNAGSMAGGVNLQAGGVMTNKTGVGGGTAATITGNAVGSAISVSGATGSVANYASIVGGVSLAAGGVVNNMTAANITGMGAGAAISISGATGSVVNAGTVTRSDAGTAISIANGGIVTNSGSISASTGVVLSSGGTMVNTGQITGTQAIVLASGGTVLNHNNIGGTISGQGTVGTTVVNYGGISALSFTNSNSVLTLQPGASVGTAMLGGGTLALVGTGGLLVNFNTAFAGYSQFDILAGASWGLQGVQDAMNPQGTRNTIANGVTLNNSGTLNLPQFIYDRNRYRFYKGSDLIIASGGDLANNGTISGTGNNLRDYGTLINTGVINVGLTLTAAMGVTGGGTITANRVQIGLSAAPEPFDNTVVFHHYGEVDVAGIGVATSYAYVSGSVGATLVLTNDSGTIGQLNIIPDSKYSRFRIAANGLSGTSIYGVGGELIRGTVGHSISLGSASYLAIAGTGAVLNNGTGSAIYDAFSFGTIINFGNVSATGSYAGIRMVGSGTIVNQSGGVIAADADAIELIANSSYIIPARVTNYGTIQSVTGRGVYLGNGGTIANAAGAIVTGGNGVVSLHRTAAVYNAGTIQAISGNAVYLAGGGLVNNSGMILGASAYAAAVSIFNAAPALTNSGTISSNNAGIYFHAGGALSNALGGTIMGAYAGLLLANPVSVAVNNHGIIIGGVGIDIRAATTVGNTIVNYGAIAGNNGTAVSFGGGDDVLAIEPGSTLSGALANFHSGATIDVIGTQANGLVYMRGTLTLENNGSPVYALTVPGMLPVAISI